MIINGREIADQILEDLKLSVQDLKDKDITPALAVILIGDEKSSTAYVKQKELKATAIGAKVDIFRFGKSVTNKEIETLIKKLDKDEKIHGIILQRPAPKQIDVDRLENFISPQKEVDGFGKSPSFPVPVAQAVIIMIEDAYISSNESESFFDWLNSKKIAVLGKGETAGQPIINLLRKNKTEPIVIDSKTPDKETLIKQADIVISAVGKATAIKASDIKKGVILIGVGLSNNSEGKLSGDYDEEEIKDIASFYTPTPGGVGPVNVAMLLENLVDAAESLTLG
jgi:methylenetetrahydrofolate dehydrogenase (NADP+)/methenyltetrahydrofolate cyclohydrolase